MKNLDRNHALVTLSSALLGSCMVSATCSVQAGELTIPNQFTAGSPAVAADVNANFSATATAVSDNQAQLTVLIARIEALEAEQIEGLSTYLSVDQAASRVTFSGANVYVNNGVGSTSSINGLGNLIVGYNRNTSSTTNMCSKGEFDAIFQCASGGGVWNNVHKSGSHNLVVGDFHNYSATSGIVAGRINNILRAGASISGGFNNTARGLYSSISGGRGHIASGDYSNVSGGINNEATGAYSSVIGGASNTASGQGSSVSAGLANTASDTYSSVTGGQTNTASGERSSVSGGFQNTASGVRSSVSGGANRSATTNNSWAAGSLSE